MTVIGLTGGIASGKSTAANWLREAGAVVIDADRLGHRVYEPGTSGFEKVVNEFGHDLVAADGTINRQILGGKVFGDPDQMKRLTDIVWPEIRRLANEDVVELRRRDKKAHIVLEAAVLIEAHWFDIVDEVWVVTVEPEVARARLMARNNLTEQQAQTRIDAQLTNAERVEHAYVTVDNSGTLEEFRGRVMAEWQKLLQRSGTETEYAAQTASAEAAAVAAAAPRKPVRAAPKAAAAAKPAAAKAAPIASKATSAPKAAPARAAAPKAAPVKTAAAKLAPKVAAVKPVASKSAPAAKAAAPAKATVVAAKATPAKPAPKAAAKPVASKAASAAKAAAKPAVKAAPVKAAPAKAAAKPAPKTPARPVASKALAPKAAARPVAKAAPAKAAARTTATAKAATTAKAPARTAAAAGRRSAR